MSLVQRLLASRVLYLWQLHLVVVGVSFLVDGLGVKESYICKCEDFPLEDRPFVAIWNAPTGGCSVNYSININLRDFDILENPKQTWDGKYVTVFYNAQLGLYPYFTNAEGTNSYNGGMPQVCELRDMFICLHGRCFRSFIFLFAVSNFQIVLCLEKSYEIRAPVLQYAVLYYNICFSCKSILLATCKITSGSIPSV